MFCQIDSQKFTNLLCRALIREIFILKCESEALFF